MIEQASCLIVDYRMQRTWVNGFPRMKDNNKSLKLFSLYQTKSCCVDAFPKEYEPVLL